jgi:hypothetical protein
MLFLNYVHENGVASESTPFNKSRIFNMRTGNTRSFMDVALLQNLTLLLFLNIYINIHMCWITDILFVINRTNNKSRRFPQ